MEKYAAVILAAGKGTRMNEGQASPIPKVMFKINDKPVIYYSSKSVQDAGVEKIVLVIGYKKELIEDYFKDQFEYAIQNEQLGTGHALMMAKDLIKDKAENIIVFGGDCPLFKAETIKKLISFYENSDLGGERPVIALLTAISEDPTGYGRIIKNDRGDVIAIREHKDCSAGELLIKEWNPGFYIFNSAWLWQNIDQLSSNNAQKEYYITDLIEMAIAQGKRVVSMPASQENEAFGINTPEQLKEAEEILQARKKVII